MKEFHIIIWLFIFTGGIALGGYITQQRFKPLLERSMGNWERLYQVNQEFVPILRQLRIDCGCGEDKVSMFAAATPFFASGNVWHPSALLDDRIEQRESELFQFPNAANDDQVDTTSMALLRLYENTSHLVAAMKRVG